MTMTDNLRALEDKWMRDAKDYALLGPAYLPNVSEVVEKMVYELAAILDAEPPAGKSEDEISRAALYLHFGELTGSEVQLVQSAYRLGTAQARQSQPVVAATLDAEQQAPPTPHLDPAHSDKDPPHPTHNFRRTK